LISAGGRLGFFGRAEPFVHPHHLGFDLGVHALRAQGEAVDVAQHFRNGHRTHHAQRARLRHAARDDACQVGAFVGAAVVGAHVLACFVACGVLEFHVRKFLAQLLHHVHVAKGGAKNELVALGHQIAQHALSVRALGHALHIGGLDFVAELGFSMAFCVPWSWA
jgi:hypothetical protein